MSVVPYSRFLTAQASRRSVGGRSVSEWKPRWRDWRPMGKPPLETAREFMAELEAVKRAAEDLKRFLAEEDRQP